MPSHSVHNYFQLFRISVDSPYPFSRESHYQSHCGRSQTSLAIVVYVCCEPSITLPSDRLPLTPHGHPMRPRAASGARAPPEGGHRRAGSGGTNQTDIQIHHKHHCQSRVICKLSRPVRMRLPAPRNETFSPQKIKITNNEKGKKIITLFP